MPHTPEPHERLLDTFGQVDIYVFDQLLKGRIAPHMRVLDAGCGHGRNVRWLLSQGAPVWGVDRSEAAVERCRTLAREVAPEPAPERFQVAEIAELPFADGDFDVVLSSAVLHFAADEGDFEAMLLEMWRVLREGGLLFARLASTIGIEARVVRHEGRRFHLPDGTDRFLVDEPYLLGLADLLGGELLDPVKTTNVQNRRAMTTWVVRKTGAAPDSVDPEAARHLRAPALAPLLDRLEAALYRSPRRAEAGEAEGGPAVAWGKADETALREEARGYPEDVSALAGELADALATVRKKGEGVDGAKALLSALRTRVLMEDTLREEGRPEG